MSDKLYDTLKFISLIIIPLANFLAKCGRRIILSGSGLLQKSAASFKEVSV